MGHLREGSSTFGANETWNEGSILYRFFFAFYLTRPRDLVEPERSVLKERGTKIKLLAGLAKNSPYVHEMLSAVCQASAITGRANELTNSNGESVTNDAKGKQFSRPHTVRH